MPKGTLDPARLHFFGHSVQYLMSSGIRWARIHADWSITVGRYDGTRGKISAVVLCSRDRLHAGEYIRAVCRGAPTDGIELIIDQYDKELSKVVRQWKT